MGTPSEREAAGRPYPDRTRVAQTPGTGAVTCDRAGVVADDEFMARFGLGGRVAVVTGAAGGIGSEAARVFATAGADVVLADRDAAGLAASASVVSSAAPGVRVTTLETDVADRARVEALATLALDEYGQVDIWANVAGLLRHSPITETGEADLDAVLGVNLKGVFFGIAAAGRAMASHGGSIVNVASAGGDMPTPNLAVYGMTKAAVIHLTKTAAVEFGAQGVRVNAVAPGFIETPMVAVHWTDSTGRVDEEAHAHVLALRAAQSPLGLTGEPWDIAYAMLYLASDATRFMTGQVLRPNGGVVMP